MSANPPSEPPATGAGGRARRALTLFSLMVAGETVFVLPFIVARVFRPTLLEVFGLSNLQLGSAFSAYGVVAMASYLFGGPLADRYSPRILIPTALLATAAGGLVFASVPSIAVLTLLYAFWGLTSILLFWAPLIRATREWGGDDAQGRAFGWLDSGRGLLAALLASLLVAYFGWLAPGDVGAEAAAAQGAALRQVMLVCTGLTVLAALLAWWQVPAGQHAAPTPDHRGLRGLAVIGRQPSVWLLAVIVVCAYVGYKSTDLYALYAVDVLGYQKLDAAWLGTLTFWMRPLAAASAGMLADRIERSQVLIWGFALVMVGAVVLAAGILPAALPTLLVLTVLSTSLGVYALRAVYFAVMSEARIPLAVTGAAVGVVSVIGYTPDIFAGPLFGYLLDGSPGAAGHQQVFTLVAGFALLGLAAVIAFRRLARPR